MPLLAIVEPSSGVIIGLIAVIFVWAGLSYSRFPSSQLTMRSRFPGEPGSSTDLGAEAAERYEREHS